MSNGLKTRLTLVGRDHAHEERQRSIGNRDHQIPGAILATGALVVGFAATATFLYYGARIVLWGLLVFAEVLR